MFDPDLYRKTCSEGMKLSGETLEEMIFMTENKKRGLRRPVQIALTAAALAVVMCVTAAAANPEAVEKFWKSFTVSVVSTDGDTVMVKADMPQINVAEKDGRVLLTIDGEQTDITDDLAQNGSYTRTFVTENGDAQLDVNGDLTWSVTCHYSDDSGTVSYSSNDQLDIMYRDDLGLEIENAQTFTFTDDETRTDAIYLPPEE